MAGWRKVDDTPESMPKFFLPVIVWMPKQKDCATAMWSGNFWHYYPVDEVMEEEVSHWQPGPEAPQPEQMSISDVVEDIIIP